jgi:hypothetical protein
MIVRGERPSDNFAQIHNAALADGRLSFKARGILAFLLSRPPGWQTSAERLAKSGVDGERAVKSGLKELEEFGYLQRSRSHKPDGTWDHNQVVTDQPIGAKQPDGDGDLNSPSTTGTKCTGGKQPDINNTELNNTYLSTGDGVNPPKLGGPSGETPPTSRTSYGDDREVVGDSNGGVEAPTPSRHYPEKPSRYRWLSDAAWRTAHDRIEIQDIALSLTLYEVRVKERNAQPTSSEWLRWLIKDEQSLMNEERRRAQENAQPKKWYSVAD